MQTTSLTVKHYKYYYWFLRCFLFLNSIARCGRVSLMLVTLIIDDLFQILNLLMAMDVRSGAGVHILYCNRKVRTATAERVYRAK